MPIVTRVLTYFLTFAFSAAALSKLYPNHPNYAHMSEKAPQWLSALGLQVLLTPFQLQTCIGAIELLCALLLPFTKAANYGLILVMLGAIFTHYRVDGAITKDAAPAAFLLSLLCLLAVFRNAQSVHPLSESTPPQQQESEGGTGAAADKKED